MFHKSLIRLPRVTYVCSLCDKKYAESDVFHEIGVGFCIAFSKDFGKHELYCPTCMKTEILIPSIASEFDSIGYCVEFLEDYKNLELLVSHENYKGKIKMTNNERIFCVYYDHGTGVYIMATNTEKFDNRVVLVSPILEKGQQFLTYKEADQLVDSLNSREEETEDE